MSNQTNPMDIKNIFLHHVDIKSNLITPIALDENSINLKGYVDSLVKDISEQTNKRLYKFKDGNTEVKNSLKEIIQNSQNIETIILNNAKRLLEKEISSQQKVSHLDIEIQKGSLLHLSFISDNINKIIICKVEHDEILSEISFDIIRGLNTKKKVFKAILIFFDENLEVTSNYVYDKNSSRYWWNDFLELNQLNTDDANTEKSLAEIDKILAKHKKKYYADYIIVRNSVIGYYRTNETLNFSDVENIFSSYTPLDVDFPKQEIITKIKELPDKKGFDTQFSISKNKINKKIQHKIKLGNNLFLSIDDYVVNLKNLIEPYQDEQGNKYVKIYSSEGYETLKGLLKDAPTNS